MSGSILSKESQQALFGYNGSRHCTEIPGEVKYFTWIHSFQIEKFVEKLYKSRQANFLDPDFPKSAKNLLTQPFGCKSEHDFFCSPTADKYML